MFNDAAALTLFRYALHAGRLLINFQPSRIFLVFYVSMIVGETVYGLIVGAPDWRTKIQNYKYIITCYRIVCNTFYSATFQS